MTLPVTVTVSDTDGTPKEGLPVYAFDGDTYTNYHGTTDEYGEVELTLPEGEYRFRADLNGTQFWSGETNHCSVPDCDSAAVAVSKPVTITVTDTDSNPKQGLPVYAFDETTYTNYHGTTDEYGEVELTLPLGSYRFRSDLNGTQFWSGETNHCDVPGCLEAAVTVSIPVTVTVEDGEGDPLESVPVYAFDGTTYTNYHGTTDAYGEVAFTLPEGSYRFRADYNSTQFWSGESNTCEIPGCLADSVTVTLPVTVTVSDTDGTPQEGLSVYAFEGTTYTSYNGTTDEFGEVAFTLLQGSCRFRADYDGVQFWSE
ncbi:MAG: hypothetical protein JXA25_12840 [Anaerolineales bacterium]|nr:hypothetical protein [Anaerolineales bacterium]